MIAELIIGQGWLVWIIFFRSVHGSYGFDTWLPSEIHQWSKCWWRRKSHGKPPHWGFGGFQAIDGRFWHQSKSDWCEPPCGANEFAFGERLDQEPCSICSDDRLLWERRIAWGQVVLLWPRHYTIFFASFLKVMICVARLCNQMWGCHTPSDAFNVLWTFRWFDFIEIVY